MDISQNDDLRAAWRVSWHQAADGARLRLGEWGVPPLGTGGGPARGTCLLVNGRSEFLEKYAEQAADWTARGWRVVSFDWRGQGLSEGEPPGPHRAGHIDDFATYLADADGLLPGLLGDAPGPVVCYAHSMGGHLMLRHVLARRPGWLALILSAPMLGIHTGPLPAGAAALIAAAACRLGLARRHAPGQHDYDSRDQRFTGNRLTSDPQRFQIAADAIAAHPGLAVGGVTFGWLDAAFRSLRQLDEALRPPPPSPPPPALPLLILSAGGDRIVRAETHAVLAKRWPGALLRRYPDALHELMMEDDAIRQTVWADIDRFLAGLRPVPRG